MAQSLMLDFAFVFAKFLPLRSPASVEGPVIMCLQIPL